MKQLNEQSLNSYMDFMIKLQKYTNKPVIALKVPISLGLTLIALGVHGFSLGLAGIDYFDEQYIKEEKDSCNLFSRFYFPQALSFLSYPRKDIFTFEKLYNHFGGCKCRWCEAKTAVNIAAGDNGVKLHHWQMMLDKVNKINEINNIDRIEYLANRIKNAILNLESIPKDIIKSQKGTDHYKLLINLRDYVNKWSGG